MLLKRRITYSADLKSFLNICRYISGLKATERVVAAEPLNFIAKVTSDGVFVLVEFACCP